MFSPRLAFILFILLLATNARGAHPLAAPGTTSLTDASVHFTVPIEHFAVLQQGDVTAVIVDNAAVDVPNLPGHRAGYSGVGSLSHAKRASNLFVPSYAGLNFEHIHDGTTEGLKEKFEPRRFPMELRFVDAHTVELYQPPTANFKLESCGRYRLLEDGTIEYTFECIPRADTFARDFIGLFWASYIHQPADMAIQFRGRKADASAESAPAWIRATTPSHGVDSGHLPAGLQRLAHVDEDFPLTLVNHRSPFVYTEPWYFGVSHDMAFVPMFRPRDQIWLVQSPSGGGPGNPAWDFQWFIFDYQVDEAYGFVMRAAYLPFVDRDQVERATRQHRIELAR
jgi:hypothetical protein